jgi:hypothetical protein
LGLKMNLAGLADEVHAVNGHDDKPGDSDVTHGTDQAGLLRGEGERPHRQEREQQGAHGDENDMEAFE